MEETKELKEEQEELKVKSFRISDEMHEKFKEIAKEIGGNQQQTLSKLVEAYNFQRGKAILTEKKSDIEQFENYVSCLTTMYMRSLEDNKNINATVQIQFEDLLKSKDETIKDLQARLKEANEIKEGATKKARALQNENDELHKEIESIEKQYNTRMDDMQKLLDDKETYNKTLLTSCDTLNKQVKQMNVEIEKAKEQQEELENLQKKYDKLQSDYGTLEANLENVKAEHKQAIEQMQKHENEAIEQAKKECKFDQDNALLELEKAHQKEIKELQKEHMAEMKEYFNSLSSPRSKKQRNTNNSKTIVPEVTEPKEAE